MKITDLKLDTIKSGAPGARGAAHGESQSWVGGWQAQTLIANPLFLDPDQPGLGVELQRGLRAPVKSCP